MASARCFFFYRSDGVPIHSGLCGAPRLRSACSNNGGMRMNDEKASFDWRGVRAMVFDMDGTLLNTEQVIVQAASDTLVHLGHAPLPADYHMPNMFGTAADLMVDVLQDRGAVVPPGGHAEAGALFERFYAAQPADAAPLYDGVLPWLQAARAQGIKLGVCTNKQHALALKGLAAHGILDWFDVVVGRDSCGIAKPAPEPLLYALAQLQVGTADAVFFGDTHADAACAQAAGVRFAWFGAGFGTPHVHDFAQALSFARYSELALNATAGMGSL